MLDPGEATSFRQVSVPVLSRHRLPSHLLDPGSSGRMMAVFLFQPKEGHGSLTASACGVQVHAPPGLIDRRILLEGIVAT